MQVWTAHSVTLNEVRLTAGTLVGAGAESPAASGVFSTTFFDEPPHASAIATTDRLATALSIRGRLLLLSVTGGRPCHRLRGCPIPRAPSISPGILPQRGCQTCAGVARMVGVVTFGLPAEGLGTPDTIARWWLSAEGTKPVRISAISPGGRIEVRSPLCKS